MIERVYKEHGSVDKSVIVASLRVWGHARNDILYCIKNSYNKEYINES